MQFLAISFCHFLLLLSLPLQVVAASNLGVSFFRAPQSLFPSGQTSASLLSKKLIGHEFLFNYLIESNHRSQWVAAQQIARDIELSHLVNYLGKVYTLVEIHNSWALLESADHERRDWAPLLELTPVTEDLGLALTLIPTSLRAGTSWSTELIKTLPARTRLVILEIKDSWLKIEVTLEEKVYVGYVDINNVLIKADFATAILDSDNQWRQVKYREGHLLLLEGNKTRSISEVKGWKTNPKLGIVIESNESKKLLLRQSAQILKTEAQTWAISQLKEHGRVFWKKSEGDTRLATGSSSTLNKEALLQREVFSVAWDPLNSKNGLVSAHGIFTTSDGGESWSKLDHFAEQDHPVSISADGSWYIGFVRSRDQGKTFRSYIQLEEIAKLVQSQIHHSPKVLKLAKIDFHQNRIEILVDAGVKKIRLATKSKGDILRDWDFLN